MSSSTTARTTAAADAESSIKPYDLVGIGIGPFNLGLAALSQPLVDGGALRAAFFDSRAEFCWHPGMMIPGTTIQVPFMADLVTLADPTSPYSFLNYCKQQGRIHQFYIKEDFQPAARGILRLLHLGLPAAEHARVELHGDVGAPRRRSRCAWSAA
mgnify:CR=1 FL=1